MADTFNHVLRAVDTGTKEVTTVAGVKGTAGTADGTGTDAQFRFPYGLAISGTSLYVVDYMNHAIRVFHTGTKDVTTLAGNKGTYGSTDGTGTLAKFSYPLGAAISGTSLYVAEYNNNAIRVVHTGTTEVTTLVGGTVGTADGTGTSAQFSRPSGLAISGTSLYVADYNNHAIRVVDTGTKEVTTVAGQKGTAGTADGTGTSAQFNAPADLAISGTSLYVAETDNYAIRVVDTDTKEVTTVAGQKGTQGAADGTGTNAKFFKPHALSFGDASTLYVVDNLAIRLMKFE